MELTTFSAIISGGVVLSALGIVVVVLVRFVPALSFVRRLVQPYVLWAAAFVAVAATVSSLVLSEHYGLPPCKLCWYQRIATYPLAVILLVAAFRHDTNIRLYATILALGGLSVSVYHGLIERFPSLESGGSCELSNPCSIIWFERFGFVTIAVGAGICLAFIATLMLLVKDPSPSDASDV